MVPEPELTLVIAADGSIIGWTIGDVFSSRDIEGENPLYLPQAKLFAQSCSLGPALLWNEREEHPENWDIQLIHSAGRRDRVQRNCVAVAISSELHRTDLLPVAGQRHSGRHSVDDRQGPSRQTNFR
ncbi:hypothetical protein GCM10025858_34350 [Alicyclobacillus sacchari]|uniref:hypothetical protein n=1 Tax=Alicyclobacillus sacchari TaxID=392010 RepID=UPI0023E9D4FC|nr:hypothetical protein [Alicyclobacillus sacchari]GMA58932.1 hypothetical protein GCM10025858_34350 [Alicyclobacillus sacchari]